MKTKTKTNLKRSLLFLIPLCLIAGMLAVPAFAAWRPVLDEIDPVQYTDIWGRTQTTAGKYAITVTEEYISATLAIITENEEETLSFNVFGNEDGTLANYQNGVVCIDLNDGTKQWYSLNVHDGGDEYVAYFTSEFFTGQFYGYALHVPNAQFGYTTIEGGTDILSMTFYIDSYPPANVSGYALDFWNGAIYTVQQVSAVAPEPPAGGDDEGGEGDTSGIFAVWTQITDWMIDGLKSATNAFYYNGQLTLLGYLCIIPIALGVALLLISIVQKFLRLRG